VVFVLDAIDTGIIHEVRNNFGPSSTSDIHSN
jgi:hypothetical protein